MIKADAKPDALLGWMASLADPTRLRLLRLIERQEVGVAELCDVVQLPQSTVSRHLKVLGDEGWLRSRRQGTNHLYRMILDELDAPARRLWLLAREQTEGWATVHQDGLRLAERLRERQTDSQAFFAGAAGEWDRLRGELYGRNFTHSALLALLPADDVVADLGCGTGPVAAQLALHVRRVIAVDNSPAMLKAATKRTAGLGNVEVLRGDLESLPIEDSTCNAALLLLAITYVPDPAAALGEVARILKPRGRVVIVDLLPHDRDDFRRQMGQVHMGFSPKEMERTLNAGAFTAISSRPLPPEPGVKGPALFIATAVKGR